MEGEKGPGKWRVGLGLFHLVAQNFFSLKKKLSNELCVCSCVREDCARYDVLPPFEPKCAEKKQTFDSFASSR